MAMTRLARWAARSPAPVFAAIGPGRQAETERLLARPGLRRAATPRDAAILLVAGDLPGDTAEALSHVHDQLPHPRATLRWQADAPDAIAARIETAWRDICAGERDEDDHLPDEPPNAWKGIGPHGQGGKGMMGGTPYGRPMAMTGTDIRDGLRLDRYTARFGPFLPMLPPGLVLQVTLQGDVICDLDVQAPPLAQAADADAPDLCAARMLRLLGLDRAAHRVMHGQSARALWLRGAVPKRIGRIDGTSARDRLIAWLAGDTVSVAPPDLPALLHGAEWAEAMLILASLPPSALIRAARGVEAA
ncbi:MULTISPECIES: hypothetical protein [Roseobacteraceae]|uniref:Uncharacterized protein n=3 Tax=Roseobacteraceae TaxID=2854170 RepID=A0A2R8BQX7_9RHOB|nr:MULTISPECIES: hypothetical protein [Roseobacteraceae]MDT0684084.1 hypothetical protein [Roseicyclus sp. F158]SEO10352.1 hypothetical protein SAMN04488011_11241 [Palleronia pelagia]SPJ22550.1 hypothetical protein PAA8504_00344 [Palleronia abyssalis]